MERIQKLLLILGCAAGADYNFVYAANGAGKGFDLGAREADIVVNRRAGHPGTRNVTGIRLASGD